MVLLNFHSSARIRNFTASPFSREQLILFKHSPFWNLLLKTISLQLFYKPFPSKITAFYIPRPQT